MDASKLSDRFFRHANMPSNLGTIEPPSGRALGVGRCGDSIEVTLGVVGERVAEVRCRPCGCEYTVACASAMSELARERTLEQALEITPRDVEVELGGLPEDHLHCARLAVNTLGEAIADCYRRRRPPVPAAGQPPVEENESDAHI
ncbi:MAG: iron-sulfur cluster assembly scaffold protein [Desulfobacterales bacterium]|jgi:nitrogen fixation NifU-like protein|nr:iron-sulfur cluster assembly scaffold protein [Desulfobacterales bacterium]